VAAPDGTFQDAVREVLAANAKHTWFWPGEQETAEKKKERSANASSLRNLRCGGCDSRPIVEDPGDGRPTTQIPAPGLLWALMIGQIPGISFHASRRGRVASERDDQRGGTGLSLVP